MRMNKRRNKKITQKAFRRMAFSSALGILACIICLAGMTWAWFTDSVTSSGNTITSSYSAYSVKVSPASERGLLRSVFARRTQDEEVEYDHTGTFELPQGSEYSIVLAADGTASKGYYRVKIGDDTYFTDTMNKGDAISFTVDCTGNGTDMEITPYWMDNPGKGNLFEGMRIDMGGHEEKETEKEEENSSAESSIENGSSQTDTVIKTQPVDNSEAGNNGEEKSGTEVTQTEGSETETGSEGDNSTSAVDEPVGGTTNEGTVTEQTLTQTTEETTTQPGAGNVSTGDVPSAESNINTGTDNQQQQE